MSNVGKTLLKGHGLCFEGEPFDDQGKRLDGFMTSGRGRGKCSCGALSPVLPSRNQRKQWHRQHKDEVRAAAQSQE